MRPLRRLPRALLLLVVVALQIGCDQATKDLAKDTLLGRSPVDLLGGLFRFVYAENPGAFLGLGGTWSPEVRFWLFTAVVGSGLLAGLLVMLLRRQISTVAFWAGATVIAGGLGNFLDRAFGGGRVVDFMQIGLGPLKTGVFNVADVQIMLGAGLLAWLAFHADAQAASEGSGAPPSASA